MCGIAGILHFNKQPVNPEEILRVTNAMQHRGPDAANCITEDELALGHRRLSIIDLSEAANQPFTDNSGRYTMVFNGEMYNFRDVKPLLNDYTFHTTSDTEVLIAAFAKWGLYVSVISKACLPLPSGTGRKKNSPSCATGWV